MKLSLKKKMMAVMAAGVLLISATPFVLAATPQPANNTQQAQTNTAQQQTQQTQQTQQQTQQSAPMQLENSKYLTKGGAAFWFIFTILLNGAFSFWVGNRFYRLSRKDNHIGAEIRALRRDIEDKMVKNVGGFAEYEIDVKNMNENLASDDEGIKPIEKKPVLREVSEEEEERFRQWEEAQKKPKAERQRSRTKALEEDEETDFDDDFEEVKKIRKKNYKPERDRKTTKKLDDEDDDLGETKVMKPIGEVKTKAKEILGDIFPFKED